MKRSTICGILLVAAANVIGQFSESDRTLNLKGVQFESVGVSGRRLVLSVAGQPPTFDPFLIPRPAPLKKRPPSELGRKVRVLLGKDVVGFALVSAVSRDVQPGSGATNAPRTKLTSISLVFDTPEQAAMAAVGLRSPDVTPSPLRHPRTTR